MTCITENTRLSLFVFDFVVLIYTEFRPEVFDVSQDKKG